MAVESFRLQSNALGKRVNLVLCDRAVGLYVPHTLGDVSTQCNFSLNYESVGILWKRIFLLPGCAV
jgi:hypothetical protein